MNLFFSELARGTENAVKMLISIIKGKDVGSTKILQTRLIERGSS